MFTNIEITKMITHFSSRLKMLLLLFFLCVVFVNERLCKTKMPETFTTPGMVVKAVPDHEDDDKLEIDLNTLKSLFERMLKTYDKRIKPLSDQSKVLHINTKITITNIIEFDTTEQKFSVLGYFKVEWRDDFLTWLPELYSGTNYVKIPVENIWTPDLKILKEFDGNNYIGDKNTDIAKISSDGDVQWVPEGMYSVVCEVDIQYYPYDEQTCLFTYYVSDESNETVAIDHTEEVNLDEYIENSAWKLVDVKKEREEKWGTYFINIHFKVQRRAHFATFTIITPLLMLAFLNIGVFLVPSGSGEKGSFAITIFLSYGIFVTIISDTLPHNSLQISYFVVFIISLLTVSALSVFYSIIQAKLMATIGSVECKLKIPCNKQRNNNRVKPIEETDEVGPDTGEDSTADDPGVFTYGMLLEKVDAWLCVTFFIITTLATVIFFCVMLNHLANELEEV